VEEHHIKAIAADHAEARQEMVAVRPLEEALQAAAEPPQAEALVEMAEEHPALLQETEDAVQDKTEAECSQNSI
jgi:hypothetical protein